jgi:SAM-dependent methyltransferase
MVDAAARGWRPVGTDLSHAACVAARRLTGAPVVQADAEALPFRDGAMATVALVNVLDHTRHPRLVTAEAARVLRPGGLLVLRVPNAGFHARWADALGRLGPLVRWRGWDTYPILHVFAFGPRALRRLLERAGFEIVQTRNSLLAALTPASTRSRAGTLTRGAARALTGTAAAAVALASAGRWLIGPSIEVYARRRRDPVP